MSLETTVSWKFWKNRNRLLVVHKVESGKMPVGAGVFRAVSPQCDNLSDWLKTADKHKTRPHPCETCGACCAFFLVSFPSSEADDVEGGFVPVAMSSRKNDSERFMNGTDMRNHRCTALQGVVGVQVKCSIYENRPTGCRKFARSWEGDSGNFLCDKARSIFGLQPFSQY